MWCSPGFIGRCLKLMKRIYKLKKVYDEIVLGSWLSLDILEEQFFGTKKSDWLRTSRSGVQIPPGSFLLYMPISIKYVCETGYEKKDRFKEQAVVS